MIKVYVDSNVFVNAKRRKEKTNKISKEFMRYVIKLNKRIDKINFFTSRYTGVELASAMIRQTGNRYRAKSILYELGKEWEDKIGLVPGNPGKEIKWEELIQKLQTIVIEYKVPASDSFTTMAILDLNPNYFVTWNKKHFNFLIKKIKNTIMVNPEEFMRELKKIKQKNKKLKEGDLFNQVFQKFFDKADISSKDKNGNLTFYEFKKGKDPEKT